MKKILAVTLILLLALCSSVFAAQAFAPPAVSNMSPSSLLNYSSLFYGYDGSSYYVPNVTSDGSILMRQTHDVSRTAITCSATNAAAGSTTTETAITLTHSVATGATTTGNSFVITQGKRFRITEFSVATRGHATATAQSTIFSLRLNLTSAVTTTSTPVILQVQSATPATSLAWDRVIFPIPEGLEIAGDGNIQFGVTAAATYTTNAPTWSVNIIGYEY